MKHILKCPECKVFTISEKCPKCGKIAVSPKPAKYSPHDKYAKYRRMAKEQEAEELTK
jgi:H/ACA ribonucleoprotein complex subunit 3